MVIPHRSDLNLCRLKENQNRQYFELLPHSTVTEIIERAIDAHLNLNREALQFYFRYIQWLKDGYLFPSEYYKWLGKGGQFWEPWIRWLEDGKKLWQLRQAALERITFGGAENKNLWKGDGVSSPRYMTLYHLELVCYFCSGDPALYGKIGYF